jgi:hypothetical protein
VEGKIDEHDRDFRDSLDRGRCDPGSLHDAPVQAQEIALKLQALEFQALEFK